jgi:hypothetical protein
MDGSTFASSGESKSAVGSALAMLQGSSQERGGRNETVLVSEWRRQRKSINMKDLLSCVCSVFYGG